ncbi:hypothetical protein DAETH_17390 [Deinococcus aetherius]|uniref:Uncharacterized protein n=1 Tax=Deinococcus aetherius TaxID=200252 RepID=A0ABN6REG4_9DEIO|nr:hypothetical protein [Deinococcus aetherius]BDP41770.1 hypothetical protein DAETH_17390 [Deinococcus aetherius]
MEPPSSGSGLTPGELRLRAAFLLWPPLPATDASILPARGGDEVGSLCRAARRGAMERAN